ncbi:hypothetical protein PM3016_3344 [Paenibacillus mucilaginosus 3016]|uniref:Bulb-type lectin domain-containing protein n=4 Tax=Paenibacillus mucilaginosus TaxID=61624 RepID=H6NHW8_9BACL|nr:hypothetical protein PM3016_3344 [Paenibacillus mucilaginosus 3016]AFH62459.2 hypothetical protein B2K_17325 [Paenibacillus mucilaginosus K02]WDM31266.1 hypothetical protein KCX80_16530 [Paenibacillus mucilaginosus]WFA22610.1 hypothetical protein ERY13_16895 [Paenibacillus mucilaginosus]
MKKLTFLLLAVFMLQFSIVSAAFAKDTLVPGEKLVEGTYLVSKNGVFSLHMQWDGNLVLYKNGSTPLWSTDTDGVNYRYFDPLAGRYFTAWPHHLHFASTPDGTVIRLSDSTERVQFWNSNNRPWSNKHYSYIGNMPTNLSGDLLIVQDDGNLVLYNTKDTARGWYPVWASNTYGR